MSAAPAPRLFNWLFARKHGGSFILRVEDTDEARNTDEARQAIFDGMSWLGLDWDEGPDKGGNYGPYFQSERRDIYDAWFQKLVDAGRVYEDDGAWRFRFERKPVTMNDLVCGEVTIDYRDESNTPDMVVKRSDGSYVFHFVNVVDDLEMEITHVIRGEDHLMNTPKHLQLIEAFGGKAPQYAHIPLILNPDGSKMSKRDAGAAVGDYPRQGFLPGAVVNFIALLGLVVQDRRGDLHDGGTGGALLAGERQPRAGALRFREMQVGEPAASSQDWTWRSSPPRPNPSSRRRVCRSGENFTAVMAAVKDKVRLLEEVPAAVDFLLRDDYSYDAEAVAKAARQHRVHRPRSKPSPQPLTACADWSADAAKAALGEVAKSAGAKPGQWMFPLRVALSGRAHGPDLGDILALLGRDRCVARLRGFGKLCENESGSR